MPTDCGKGGESISGVQETSSTKIHDIRKLTLEALIHEPRFNEVMDMAVALTPYAWEFRYPDDLAATNPTRKEFDEALQHAQAIYDFILDLLPADARP